MTTFNSGMDPLRREAIASELAISILLICRSALGTGSSGGLLSQQRDSAIPGEILTGRKIFPSGGGINTDVREKRKDTRELSAESTLGTSFRVWKRIGRVKAASPSQLRLSNWLFDTKKIYGTARACRCRLEYPVHRAFLADNVHEGRGVVEIYPV